MQTIALTIDGRDYVAIPAEDYRRLTAAERAPAAGLAGQDAIAYARQRIGASLRAARQTAGLSQQALAERLGVTQPTVSGHESGANGIGDALIARWLTACGLPGDWEPEGDPPD